MPRNAMRSPTVITYSNGNRRTRSERQKLAQSGTAGDSLADTPPGSSAGLLSPQSPPGFRQIFHCASLDKLIEVQPILPKDWAIAWGTYLYSIRSGCADERVTDASNQNICFAVPYSSDRYWIPAAAWTSEVIPHRCFECESLQICDEDCIADKFFMTQIRCISGKGKTCRVRGH